MKRMILTTLMLLTLTGSAAANLKPPGESDSDDDGDSISLVEVVKAAEKIAEVVSDSTPLPNPPPPPDIQLDLPALIPIVQDVPPPPAPSFDPPDRDGYCSPVPVLRADGTWGQFLDLYKDEESRKLYHAQGLIDAYRDPITGSLSCDFPKP